MKNYFLWVELVGTLASVVANQSGENVDRELTYLNLLTTGAREKTLTDEALAELHTRIKAEKLSGYVPTNDELLALEVRLIGRSAQIQGSGG